MTDDAVLDTLVAGFLDDPLYHWLYPNPATRPDALRANLALTVELGREVGHVDVAPDTAGVAIWTDPGVPLLDDPAPFVALLEHWAPDRTNAAIAGMQACAVHAPEQAATLHVIAVRPDMRGRGVGARLLQPWLDHLDAQGWAGHLDSSNQQNLSFYERSGFEVVAEVPVPDGGPVMRPMTRGSMA